MTAATRQRGIGLVEVMVFVLLLSLAAAVWFTGIETDHTESRAMITVKSTQLVSQYVHLYGIAKAGLPTDDGDCGDGYTLLAQDLGAQGWPSTGAENGWQEAITLHCSAGSQTVTLQQKIPQPELVGFLLEHLAYTEAELDPSGEFALLRTDIELDFPDTLNLIQSVPLQLHDDFAQAEVNTRRFCRRGTITYSARLPVLCAERRYDGDSQFWVQQWLIEDHTVDEHRRVIFRVAAEIQKGIAIPGATPERDGLFQVAVADSCRPQGEATLPANLDIMLFCDDKLR